MPPLLSRIASDLFNRGNGGLGSNWTTEGGTNNLQIVSNAVQATTPATANFGYWNASTFPNDQWMQVTAVTLNPADVSAAFNGTTRSQKVNPRSYYQFYGQQPFSGGASVLQKIVAGVATVLVQNSVQWSSGDVMFATSIGTTHTFYKNGVAILTTTDSAFASGVPGMGARPSTTNSNVVIDNWSAGGFINNLLQMMGCGT